MAMEEHLMEKISSDLAMTVLGMLQFLDFILTIAEINLPY